MAELFKEVISDISVDDKKGFEEERKILVAEISAQNNLLTKIRAMLLSDDIDMQDYKIMKGQSEEKIIRYEAELKDLKEKNNTKTDYTEFIDEAVIRLKNLMELYSNSDIEEKRYIIGSTFPEKWVILENNCRTGNVNLAALLIYHINKWLEKKKVGFRTKIRTKSDSVLYGIIMSKKFNEHLKVLAQLPLNLLPFPESFRGILKTGEFDEKD